MAHHFWSFCFRFLSELTLVSLHWCYLFYHIVGLLHTLLLPSPLTSVVGSLYVRHCSWVVFVRFSEHAALWHFSAVSLLQSYAVYVHAHYQNFAFAFRVRSEDMWIDICTTNFRLAFPRKHTASKYRKLLRPINRFLVRWTYQIFSDTASNKARDGVLCTAKSLLYNLNRCLRCFLTTAVFIAMQPLSRFLLLWIRGLIFIALEPRNINLQVHGSLIIGYGDCFWAMRLCALVYYTVNIIRAFVILCRTLGLFTVIWCIFSAHNSFFVEMLLLMAMANYHSVFFKLLTFTCAFCTLCFFQCRPPTFFRFYNLNSGLFWLFL